MGFGRSNTTSFSAGSVRDDDLDELDFQEQEVRSWTDHQTVGQIYGMNEDIATVFALNIGVHTMGALAEAEATREELESERDTWVGSTAAPSETSTATPSSCEDQMLRSDPGRHAPLTLLPPPQTWRPAVHDLLLVTKIWRDLIWVWNESASDSHHGVGIVISRWLVGERHHFQPEAQKHVFIDWHFQDQEDSDLTVVQMTPIWPQGWPWGHCCLMVRWLEGW